MSNDKLNDQDDHDLDADLGDDYFDELDDDSSSDVDGEWDEVDGNAPYEQPKKKKSLSNIIIIGVAIVAGLIFMVFKFGGGSSTTPSGEVADPNAPVQAEFAEAQGDVSPSLLSPTPDTATIAPQEENATDVTPALAPENPGPLTPMPMEMAAQDELAPAPLLSDPAAPVEQPPSLMTTPDMTSPAEMPQPIVDANAPPQMEPTPETSETSVIQPVSDFPSADMIKKIDMAPVPTSEPAPLLDAAPVTPTESPIEVPAPVVDAAPASASIPVAVPDNTVEMNQALDKIKKLEGSVDKNNQVILGYESQISDLKDKVADLETKLEKASKQIVSSPKEASSAKKAEVKPPKEEQIVMTSGTNDEEVIAPVEEAPVKWVLKGAQSGRALLGSTDQKQADVRTVSVGDKVPGLGTILSIQKGQSGWVVLGTLGKVTE